MENENRLDILEIGKIYYTWEKTYEYHLCKIKIIKITPKNIFYKNLYENNLNWNTQILIDNLNCLCLEKVRAKIYLTIYLDSRINFNLEEIKRLKKIKKEFS